MIRVHGLANCDTVKKARAWLDGRGLAHAFVDFKKTPPSRDQVARWCAALGVDVVLNRRGTTWRALDAGTQASASTPDGAIDLLVAHPSAIRRPLIEAGSDVLIGFDAERYERQFGS